ncbi:RNase H [Phytophthora megakarya]|uniref:RNase H n=1 Tax=Phytophthora megakarya TaxID=4795 RepID=A0A225VPB7_9STRA|nr:RNase H [Phytophthora megakarya]
MAALAALERANVEDSGKMKVLFIYSDCKLRVEWMNGATMAGGRWRERIFEIKIFSTSWWKHKRIDECSDEKCAQTPASDTGPLSGTTLREPKHVR